MVQSFSMLIAGDMRLSRDVESGSFFLTARTHHSLTLHAFAVVESGITLIFNLLSWTIAHALSLLSDLIY